jgi:beta-galactosidase
VAEDELRTAGKAARIVLSAERATVSAGSQDAVVIVATAADDAGLPVPAADNEVQFTVSGPAEILATDNGDTAGHESFLLPRRRLFGGRAIAILRATASSGSIQVHASAAGLVGGDARLTAVAGNPSHLARAF